MLRKLRLLGYALNHCAREGGGRVERLGAPAGGGGGPTPFLMMRAVPLNLRSIIFNFTTSSGRQSTSPLGHLSSKETGTNCF